MKYKIIESIPKVEIFTGCGYTQLFLVNEIEKYFYLTLGIINQIESFQIELTRWNVKTAIKLIEELVRCNFYPIQTTCRICGTELFLNNCVNINCQCGNPMKSFRSKILILNPNVTDDIYNKYIWGLKESLNSELSEFILHLNTVNKINGFGNKATSKVIDEIVTNYKSLNVKQFFQLCKHPIEYEELIDDLNLMMTLSQLIASKDILSYVLPEVHYDSTFVNYIKHSVDINKEFLNKFIYFRL